MGKLNSGMIIMLLGMLVACGPEGENPTQAQESKGILTNRQQQALDGAASVEQILLDSAADREKELEAQLRTQSRAQ